MSTEPETIAVQHEYIVDGEFSPRMARAFTAFTFSRPALIATFIVLALLGVVLLVLAAWIDNPVFAALGVAYVLFIPAYALVVYRRTLRSNARRLPVGSRIAVGLGESGIRTEGPLGSGVSAYRAYRSVTVAGSFVILRHQGIRVFSLFPVELFPGSDLDTLRGAVEKANR